MSDRYARVTKFVVQHPWAIIPERLDALLEVLALRIEGRALTEEEIQARLASVPPPPPRRTAQAVAVLPVFGVLAHRMDLMTKVSGGTSVEGLAAAFDQAVADPAISAIVLDVDSPGGSVFGVQEFAERIYHARGAKPVVAVANATAASAAYWLASQADQLVVTPSGQVGSIGVVAVHQDRSKQAEMLGVRPTFITAGKFKASGNELEPLDEAARADMQHRVDQYYAAFVAAVARGRGVSRATVRDGFGEGRIVSARDAVAQGMADGESTLDEVLGRLVAGEPALGAHAAAPALPATVRAVGAAAESEDFRRRLSAYEA